MTDKELREEILHCRREIRNLVCEFNRETNTEKGRELANKIYYVANRIVELDAIQKERELKNLKQSMTLVIEDIKKTVRERFGVS